MLGAVLAILLLLTLVAGFALAGLRARKWLAGAPADVDLFTGVMALPRRYLVDVHHVVARKSFNARFHALTAGGFLASLPLLLLCGIPALQGPILWGLTVLALGVMLIGTFMVGWRRQVVRPREVSQGKFKRLPFSLLAYASGFFILSLDQLFGGLLPLPIAFILLLIGIAGGADLVLGVGRGPLKHAVNGALHLIAHPRPLRFADAKGLDTGLKPITLGNQKLGAEAASDFAWNRLLGFDACVQCGRCEEACPAYAAELPLNPKKLIQDLSLSLDETATDKTYAGHDHPGCEAHIAKGGFHEKLIGNNAMIAPETLWACTTCRACVEACPMMIEHVDAIIDLRRFETLERGATPGKAPIVLEELKATDNPGGLAPARRIDWASDLGLSNIADTGSTDILLWLGDAAFDLRGQRSLRAFIRTLKRANIDFAVLGEDECDCGDLARRLGDEAGFQRLAKANIATLSQYRFNRIVTMDPHVLHVIRNEYPAFGGDYTISHHSALLLELMEAGRLTPKPQNSSPITYHDPCYLGRYNGEFAAPRALLDRLGFERVEMEKSQRQSHCCGGGGGAPVTDIAGKRRIPDMRMDQVRTTGAPQVAVGCPNCTLMLEGVTGPRPEVKDLAELIWEAVQ